MPGGRSAQRDSDAGAGHGASTGSSRNKPLGTCRTAVRDVWVIDPAPSPCREVPWRPELQQVVRVLRHADNVRHRDVGDHTSVDTKGPVSPATRSASSDPYNIYLHTDGQVRDLGGRADQEAVWYDPHHMGRVRETATPDCAGIDHADSASMARPRCSPASSPAGRRVEWRTHTLSDVNMPQREHRDGAAGHQS